MPLKPPPPPRAWTTSRLAPYLGPTIIIFLALLIRLPLVGVPLIYSNDIWRQADTATIARNFLRNGFHLLYPQIYWGGTGPGYVETEFQLYPFVVAQLYRVFGEHLILGRLVSLLFLPPTLLCFYGLARRLLGVLPALGAMAFFAISPLYVRYSIAFMPESTVLCCYTGALYFFCRWRDDPRRALLLAAAGFTALSILVKPTSVHIGLVFFILLYLRHGLSFLRQRDLWVFAAVSLLPAALYFHHARWIYLTYGNTFGLFSGGDNKFGGLRYWLSPRFYLAIFNLDRGWIFTNAGLVLFAAGAGIAARRRHPSVLFAGLLSIFVYYLIVARYAQVSWAVHYHVYLLPYAALGVGVAFSWLQDHTSRIAGPVFALAILALIGGRSRNLYQEMRHPEPAPEIECARRVAGLTAPDRPIIVTTRSKSVEDGVVNNYQDPIIFFYSDRHGFSLPADHLLGDQSGWLDSMRHAGARELVVSYASLLADHPPFAQYLRDHADLLDSAPGGECSVYHLR